MKSMQRQGGAALILVLWLVVALSLVVLAGARGVRLHTQRSAFELDRMRVQAALDAAIQVTASALMADNSLPAGYQRLQLHLGDARIDIEVVPGDGLIDINVASPEVLEALLVRVGGLAPGEATVMEARIRDFIDPDDIPSGVGGAELAQYQAAGAVGRPKNGGLDDLDELRFVLGMSPELYATIFPFLGLNGQQRIVIGSAPPELIDLLSAQPGLGDRVRALGAESQASLVQSGLLSSLFTASTSMKNQTIRVRARIQSADQRIWERLVWLDLSTRPQAVTPWTTRSIEPVRRVTAPQRETPSS